MYGTHWPVTVYQSNIVVIRYSFSVLFYYFFYFLVLFCFGWVFLLFISCVFNFRFAAIAFKCSFSIWPIRQPLLSTIFPQSQDPWFIFLFHVCLYFIFIVFLNISIGVLASKIVLNTSLSFFLSLLSLSQPHIHNYTIQLTTIFFIIAPMFI